MTVVLGIKVRVSSNAEKTFASGDSDGAGSIDRLGNGVIVRMEEPSALKLGDEQVDDLWR